MRNDGHFLHLEKKKRAETKEGRTSVLVGRRPLLAFRVHSKTYICTLAKVRIAKMPVVYLHFRPEAKHMPSLSLRLSHSGSSMNCWTSDALHGSTRTILENLGHENEKAEEQLQFRASSLALSL